MGSIFIGIDLGTSSLKTILVNPENKSVLAESAVEYAISTPHPGWAEQDPKIWIAALVNTIRSVLDQTNIPPALISGIGFSGQMHGTVCLDGQHHPLRPAIIWADQRSQKQVQSIYSTQGVEKIGAATGNPIATGFMLPTLLWLEENEPDLYQRIYKVLLPKDYLRFVMTGVFGTEPSDASSTGLFNQVSRAWNQAWLAEFGISPELLPSVMPSHANAGIITAQFAAQSGLCEGTPVYFGASDQSAQALGNGVVRPGDICCTIGTGGQIFAPVLQPVYDQKLRLHLFCHAIPDVWHLEAATLSAGLSLKWLRDHFFEDKSYRELVDEAGKVSPGAEGLIYLPYLAGERTPIMNPLATGSFTGLTLRHTRAHLVRSVMEGVVFSLKQGMELIQSFRAPIERVIASGGGTRHPLWLQLQADIFNLPIQISNTREAAALGAAMLAAIGNGYYTTFEEACRQLVNWDPIIIEPNRANARFYRDVFERFGSMYPTLLSTYSNEHNFQKGFDD